MRIGIIAVALAACGPKLEVPPELEGEADALAVEGRAADPFTIAELRVGPYLARRIRRGFESELVAEGRFGAATLDLAGFPPDESFSFVLDPKSEGGDWPSVCTTAQSDRHGGVALGPLGSAANHLTCICGDPASKIAWRLELMTDDKGPRGVFGSGEQSFRIQSSYVADEANRKKRILTGYLVSRGGRPLAAVDIAAGGAVWVAKSLDGRDRDAVACAAVALLLREPSR
jgi:hypothetical protein